MKKISTLFNKNPKNLGRVVNEINPKNEWVFEYGIPTRKFDGTSCAIIDGELYKRYDAKKNKKGIKKPIPKGAIPCQEADDITGHHPHWIKCDVKDKSNKYHFEAFENLIKLNPTPIDGTYELCGEKVQGNPENIKGHKLIMHGKDILHLPKYDFDSIKNFLTEYNIEGIVFHENKTPFRMCKIRKSDFGIKRN